MMHTPVLIGTMSKHFQARLMPTYFTLEYSPTIISMILSSDIFGKC